MRAGSVTAAHLIQAAFKAEKLAVLQPEAGGAAKHGNISRHGVQHIIRQGAAE
ncbi:hypothetical protein D3C85_1635920 [compost metagenome]